MSWTADGTGAVDVATEDPWTPMKDLSCLVEATVLKRQPGLQPDLEAALKKHEQLFIGLLKNPVPSSSDAALVRKASTEGIRLPAGEGNASIKQKLPPQMVEEALILSDMFQMNEISSLQLLIQAEDQLCHYPGLTRGLVSVILYYDAQRCLVHSLRTLVQGRQGVTWTLGASQDVTDIITSFTQNLLNCGLVDTILAALSDMDWNKECLMLQKNLALGDAKHRRLVHDMYEDVRQSLADTVFAFAAQSGLPKKDTLSLLDTVSKIKLNEGGPDGDMDDVNLTLTMALLYAVNVSVVNKDHDCEEVLQSLPILKDPDFIPALHSELGPNGGGSNSSLRSGRRWLHPAVQSVVQFAWAMSLATLRSSTLQLTAAQNVVDDDELVLDAALENSLFHRMPHYIITAKTVKCEEFYLRRIHQLLTDLIILMPLKVKELRNRADDGARNKMMYEHEGINYSVPLIGQHFENLLLCLAKLYEDNSLGLDLVLEYWCPAGDTQERYPLRNVSLFKFVRLAGDLLLPSLYKPYIEMLVSLSGHPQAAMHCFNLLKINGGATSSVSWDHFFSSLHQYFANLRQESQFSSIDTIYRVSTRPMTRGISPAEVHGLVSVLRLIGSVCYHSEPARLAVAEHPGWQPVMVLVGLLSCPVPTVLKVEILLTLAALARSHDIAHLIWQSMEAAQLIPDRGMTGSQMQFQNTTTLFHTQQQPLLPAQQQALTQPLQHQQQQLHQPPQQLPKHNQHLQFTNQSRPLSGGGGLLTELQEVECKNEEYPLSRAFLSLVLILLSTDDAIPASVSIQPYVAFIRDAILLRFNSRAYKTPDEKWAVGAAALKIVDKIIADYRPAEHDFDEKMSASSPSTWRPHPGFHIIIELLQQSELLRQLLFILDEGVNWLDRYAPFPGKAHLEDCCLLVLRVMSRALEIQPAMMAHARVSGTSKILTPLDKLLLGVNPRSGKPDHMMNVVKFVIFSWWLPEHCLHAVRILKLVASKASTHPFLLATFTTTDLAANLIIKGFTEVLESDQEVVQGHDVKVAVVELLQKGLDISATPSLSHFLLGFDLRCIQKCTIQPPGVMGAVRSPFHAILELLRPNGNQAPSDAFVKSPHLVELAFRLIFTLALSSQTSEPTLRFLRSSEDFLNSQLAVLPLPEGANVCPQALRGVSWLLKTVAIELKYLGLGRQRSHISRITSLLLDGALASVGGSGGFSAGSGGGGGSSNSTANSRSAGNDHCAGSERFASSDTALTQLPRLLAKSVRQEARVYRLLALLNAIDFEDHPISLSGLNMCEESQVHEVFKSLETVSPVSGAKAIDVKTLFTVLSGELCNVQGSAAVVGQNQVIEEEISAVLKYAVQWNKRQEQQLTQRNLLDAWRQVTEILLCCVPIEVLPALQKQQLLLELLQNLLNQVLNDSSSAELCNQVSGVMLMLMTSLRQTYSPLVDSLALMGATNADTFVALLDSQHSDSSGVQVPKRFSTALQVILKGLVMWMVGTSSSAQRARANIYGALLNYLRIGRQSSAEGARQQKANFEVLTSFGDLFIDIVCKDAVSGHDVRRMLALSLLDELSALDAGRSSSWLWYMSRHGYLRHIIDSLVTEDVQLIQLLGQTEQPHLRSLFTYESKMALLTRIASTAPGAELLLESGLMLRLADIRVFSSRPESLSLSSKGRQDNELAQEGGPKARYQQILFPALRLCQSVLASLGSGNRSAVAQVLHFVVANQNMIRDVLHYKDIMTPSGLQELVLLSGVVARCAWIDAEESSSLDVLSHLSGIQRQIMFLISHLGIVDSALNKMGALHTEEDAALNHRNVQFMLEIQANLLLFARNLMTRGSSANKGISLILFGPSLAEACQHQMDVDTHNRGVAFSNRPPSLGHLVLMVRHLVSHLLTCENKLRETRDKLRSVATLSSNELSSYVPHKIADKLSSYDKRTVAAARMQEHIKHLEHDIRLATEAMESGLLIIWSHLEYFISMSSGSVAKTSSLSEDLWAASGISSIRCVADLKKDASACFDNAFFMKIHDVIKTYTKDSDFVEAIIRRLQRISLLQTV